MRVRFVLCSDKDGYTCSEMYSDIPQREMWLPKSRVFTVIDSPDALMPWLAVVGVFLTVRKLHNCNPSRGSRLSFWIYSVMNK